MLAMAGAGEAHNLIVANRLAAVHQQLRARPCRVYPSDMRVRDSATGLYAYPDMRFAANRSSWTRPAVPC
jgi:hypothetical protein